MRAIWSGEIAFGLVTIPAKLYSATKDLTPQFHQLHKECGTRIQLVRRCPKCSRDLALMPPFSYARAEKGKRGGGGLRTVSNLYFSSASPRRCIFSKSVERRVDTSNRTGRPQDLERMQVTVLIHTSAPVREIGCARCACYVRSRERATRPTTSGTTRRQRNSPSASSRRDRRRRRVGRRRPREAPSRRRVGEVCLGNAQSRRHLVTNRRARYSEGPCAAA
jgi:hypothetical protein